MLLPSPIAALLLTLAAGSGDERAAVDFAREVRPLLAERCFTCHGPDDATREAGLRLDAHAAATEDRGGYAAIVPGDSGASELVYRISSEADPMPPDGVGEPLSAEEIDVLRRWIDEGASWKQHWSYVAPERPSVPATKDAAWPRIDLDHFILERLEAEGLAPSPEAAPEALARRASLDVTGLPPTLEDLDAFLAAWDQDPDAAYAAYVERLLHSDARAEEHTRRWLDAVRYADTHGLHLDNERSLWPYRDWVIRAFADNKPFDEFTLEQLAGDLLPEPSLDQRIATGYLRCNPSSAEGGMIATEYLALYAMDRLSTTSTLWLGSTVACAQCHDHKFDPVSQKDFYRFKAFFDGLADGASDGNAIAPPPAIPAPDAQQRVVLKDLDQRVDGLRATLDAPDPELDAKQVTWERERGAQYAARWHDLAPLSVTSRGGAEARLEPDGSIRFVGESPDQDVIEVVAQTDLRGISGVLVEALADEDLPGGGPGRGDNGNFVLSSIELEYAPSGRDAAFVSVPLVLGIADHSQPTYRVEHALDGDPSTGWGVVTDLGRDHRALFVPAFPIHPAPGETGETSETGGRGGTGEASGTVVRVRLGFESPHQRHVIGRLRLSLSAGPPLHPVELSDWSVSGPYPADSGKQAFATAYAPEALAELDATLRTPDGAARFWTPRPDYVDEETHLLSGGVCATYLQRSLRVTSARRMTFAVDSDDAVQVWLNGEVVLERDVQRPIETGFDRFSVQLPAGESRLLVKVVNYGGGYAFRFRTYGEDPDPVPLQLARALVLPRDERSDAALELLRRRFRSERSPEWRALAGEVDALEAEREDLVAGFARTLVAEELAEPRPTFVLERGSYDRPAERVEPGVPPMLPPLPASEGRPTRLDLARWLVAPENPLTARVVVNRIWQQHFGTGLVETPEDFGSRGAWPSHPELLDYLATEFVALGWDLRALERQILLSSTYRQSAHMRPELLTRDPANRLLARGPRLRLDAGTIRDQALALSGLLVPRVGGPPVRPYQPQGVWYAVAYTSSNTARFMRDEGDALWRRSLYTFWKRTAPPPALALFDAPSRDTACVQRARTNTPLQALALLNDEQMVEAARAFAQRILRLGGTDRVQRATFAFRSATSRLPSPAERAVLESLAAAQLERYRADPEAAAALIGVGASLPDAGLDPAELAAWTVVASTILNHDETITRG